LDKERWLEARKENLLPTAYFHPVFTVPEGFKPVALRNQEVAYSILFKAASESLKELTGAEVGFIAVLHTWAQTLIDHPHLHCIVTGGGLSPDGLQWISCKKKFFLPVKVLSRLFRGKFLAYLKDASMVMDYLGRYTHRVAMSNNRLVNLEGGKVTFRYRDRRDNDKVKPMNLDANEFIRRFLLHILPDGFMKIRHYGLLSNRSRKDKLGQCKRLLGVDCRKEGREKKKESWQDLLTRVTGNDPRICPYCGKGRMVLKEVINPSAPPLAP
jgi:hypothetical protein